jgi:hypothetical protein
MNISLSNLEYNAISEPYLRETDQRVYQKLASALLAIILAVSLVSLGGFEWPRIPQESTHESTAPKIEVNYGDNFSDHLWNEAEQEPISSGGSIVTIR